MKKMFLVLFFLYLFMFSIKVNTKSITASNDFYAIYELYTNTTTKNILNYVDSNKIIQIIPKNKKEFQDYSYNFKLNPSIDKLEKEYMRLLKKYNYNTDISYIGFKGVYLYRVVLYATQNEIVRLLNTKRFSTNNP